MCRGEDGLIELGKTEDMEAPKETCSDLVSIRSDREETTNLQMFRG